MSYDYDVTIVGAGLIGSTFALSLARKTNLSIAVIERAGRIENNPNQNERVVALGSTATLLLQELEIFSLLSKDKCFPYTAMYIWDDMTEGVLQFNSLESNQDVLGHMIDSIECNLLLQNAMESQNNIDTFYQSKVKDLHFTPEGTSLEFVNGAYNGSGINRFCSKLIVAADGVNSWIRQKAKIYSHLHTYNQKGLVATIETSKSHQNTAFQKFLSTGPLAILPLNENRSSIVWSADNELAEYLLGLDNVTFEKELESTLNGKLGKVTLVSDRKAFPILSRKADEYYKDRLVLIGDAAHSIHPLAGQGANLGFKDIQSLLTILTELDAVDLGNTKNLKKYQQSRKADNEQTDWMMGALYNAYQSESPWWLVAREKGMNWISSSPRIKALLVKQAMGI